jgi:hypothetical protein
VLVPDPIVVAPPGLLVKVHVPKDGSELRITLPVGVVQLVWVITPTTGVAGVTGCEGITTLAEGNEVHPASFVTV